MSSKLTTRIPKKHTTKKTYGKFEAMYRTSEITMTVKSFGNSDQHLQTLNKIVGELDLRGFNVSDVVITSKT
jgi:hypothetical protein